MSGPEFRNFEEYWPHYVRQHSRKTTRLLHVAGTGAAMVALTVGLLRRRSRWLVALAPALAIGGAWAGHRLVEHNHLALLAHPMWSLRANLTMFAKTVGGTMDAECEAVASSPISPDDEPAPSTAEVYVHVDVDGRADDVDPHSMN